MAAEAAIPDQTYQRAGYQISTDKALLQIDVVHDYLARQSYWAQGVPLQTVTTAIANSLCYGVYDSKAQQVGFARVVTDYATFAYLADVFILPAAQGQGLGKWLVSCIMADPQLVGLRRWTLYTRDAQRLYERFGFVEEPEPGRHMVLRRADATQDHLRREE